MGSERTFTYCSCKSTEAVVGLFSYGSRPRAVRRWTDVYVESLDHRMSFGLVWFIGALYKSPICPMSYVLYLCLFMLFMLLCYLCLCYCVYVYLCYYVMLCLLCYVYVNVIYVYLCYVYVYIFICLCPICLCPL